MPPEPVPVVRFRAAVVVVVVFLCFRLLEPPALARGADVGFVGDRLPLPTDVELAGAGILSVLCFSGYSPKHFKVQIENTRIILSTG